MLVKTGGIVFLSLWLISCKKTPDVTPTTASLPEVYTATSFSPFTFVLITGGTVSREGSSPVTDRGVCWSTSHNPTLANDHFSFGTGPGQFTGQLIGFTGGTLYYIRAYATNSKGTAYGNESTAQTPTLNVLVGGYERLDNGATIGRIWMNGYRSGFIYGDNVKGVCVKGYDIYLASTKFSKAVYWKNSTEHILTGSTGYENSEANGLVVSDTNVYVVGNLRNNTTGFFEAAYWKNGVPVRIGDGSRNSYGKAIYVSGNDVYVAWVENSGTNIARVWHNGVGSYLTSGLTNATAESIFVSGNDVYVAGSEEGANGKYTAKYWKNGVATSLTDGTVNSVATSIALLGNDLYVTGTQANQQAKLWKNGVLTNLTGITTNNFATGLYPFGSDIFYTGSIGNFGVLWKNTEASSFTDGVSPAAGNAVSVSQ